MAEKNMINAPKAHHQLTAEQLHYMNKLTEVGNLLGDMLNDLELDTSVNIDPRWMNIGKSQLQQGIMAVKRAVAKPDFF